MLGAGYCLPSPTGRTTLSSSWLTNAQSFQEDEQWRSNKQCADHTRPWKQDFHTPPYVISMIHLPFHRRCEYNVFGEPLSVCSNCTTGKYLFPLKLWKKVRVTIKVVHVQVVERILNGQNKVFDHPGRQILFHWPILFAQIILKIKNIACLDFA